MNEDVSVRTWIILKHKEQVLKLENKNKQSDYWQTNCDFSLLESTYQQVPVREKKLPFILKYRTDNNLYW